MEPDFEYRPVKLQIAELGGNLCCQLRGCAAAFCPKAGGAVVVALLQLPQANLQFGALLFQVRSAEPFSGVNTTSAVCVVPTGISMAVFLNFIAVISI